MPARIAASPQFRLPEGAFARVAGSYDNNKGEPCANWSFTGRY
jgi:hypothetical protein